MATDTLGAGVRAVRGDVRMTLRELSRKTGISPAHISDIENGHRGASPIVCRKISKATKSNPLYLLRLAAFHRALRVDRDLRRYGYQVKVVKV